ncbi:MAG: hypothetical protein O7G84_01070 [Gammaproteobacteria bacterium]|nr:hypothetical protein [Gammaproteobacteria bacterium]
MPERGYTVAELLAIPGCESVSLFGADGSGVKVTRPPGKWVPALREICRHDIKGHCEDCMIHGPDMEWETD